MLKKLKSRLQGNKKFLLSILNFLLFPYVLGRCDKEDAGWFTVVNKNRSAFRSPGKIDWSITNDPYCPGYISTVGNKTEWQKQLWWIFDFAVFKDVFNKEQFRHPFRAALIESLIF